MSWSDFYLICFALGFILSLLSLLGSAHLHLPHIDIHLGGGHAHAPHAGGGGGGEVAPINFGTVSAFLAWFGGAGYLLTRIYNFWFLIALGIACVSGLAGAVAKGTEVVVTRYERGIAYVRPWEELTNSSAASEQN